MKLFPGVLIAILCTTQIFAQYKIRDSCANFTLKIEAYNLTSDTVIILYPDCDKRQDTIILSNGKGTITGKINRATEGILFANIKNRWMDAPSVIRFIMEPSYMKLSFKMVNDTASNVVMGGSHSQQEKETWEMNNSSLLNLREKYRDELTQLSRDKQKIAKREFEDKEHFLNNKFEGLTESLIEVILKYIKTNPRSYFSGYLLYHYNKQLTPDTLETYYSYLDSSVMYCELGKRILNELFKLTDNWAFKQKFTDTAYYEKLRSIKTIYDVELTNLLGKKTSFSEFRGNFILLDFWAGWCGPCIKNAPHLEKIITEMKNKPLKVISVSIDENIAIWKKSLEKYGFPGLHLFDGEGLLSIFYKVLWIPRYIIINPDGTVANMDAPQPIDPKLKFIIDDLLRKNNDYP